MKLKPCCEGTDEATIEKIKECMPHEDDSYKLARFFKVFGDSTRVKLIHVLSQNEMCVGTISRVLDMSQSSVSHQLRILRDNRLVKVRREGKLSYYSLDDAHVHSIYRMGFEHIVDSKGCGE